MEDKVFINLVNKEVLKELEIDYRLTDVFTNFIIKLQKYFVSNNYTTLKNYKSFFENYLFDINTSKRFAIEVNDEPKSKSFYDKDTNRIVINISVINSDELEYILAKEFIKFMTIHDLQENRASVSLTNNKFTASAISEYIAHELYPNSVLTTELELYNFYNILTNNYPEIPSFLNGKLNPNLEYQKFEKYADAYHLSILNSDANINENLTLSIRYLIKTLLTHEKISSIDDIVMVAENLHLSPISDRTFIDELFTDLSYDLVNKFKFSSELSAQYEKLLSELLLLTLEKNNILDDTLNDKIKNLKMLFDSSSKSDIKAINKVLGNDDLSSIKKYQLPVINNYNISLNRDIYIAEYDEKIEILSDITPIGKIDEFKEGRYIGKSSSNDKTLVVDDIRDESIGYMYALISEDNLEETCSKDLIVEIKRLVTPVYMNEMIDRYLIEHPDDFNKVDKEQLALSFEALKKFRELPYKEKREMIDNHLNEVEKVIISINDKKLSVSLVCNEKEKKSLKGDFIYLYDKDNCGIYNELIPFMNILTNKPIINSNFVLQLNGRESIDFQNVNPIKPEVDFISEAENLLNIKLDVDIISEDDVLKKLESLYYESDLEAERYKKMKEAINKLFKKNKGEVAQAPAAQPAVMPQGQVPLEQMAAPVQAAPIMEGVQPTPVSLVGQVPVVPAPSINVPGTAPIMQSPVQAPIEQSVPVVEAAQPMPAMQDVPVSPVVSEMQVQPSAVETVIPSPMPTVEPVVTTPVSEPMINQSPIEPVVQPVAVEPIIPTPVPTVEPVITAPVSEPVFNPASVAPVAAAPVDQTVQSDIVR